MFMGRKNSHKLLAELDPHNSGVLIVHLDGNSGEGHNVDSNEIAQRLEESDSKCIIT